MGMEPGKEARVPQPPQRPAPALGVKDGIRRDMQAAKEAGVAYDPRGVGCAWTHGFLAKKPWHPNTFRNKAKVFEAEQARYEAEKREAEGRAEFEAEQAYMKTLSLLSPAERERYNARQSVSFLYTKPPGYDAALKRTSEASAQPAAGGGGGAAGEPPPQQAERQQQRGGAMDSRRGGNHVAKVVSGFKAVADAQQLQLKRTANGGRSPPRGGGDVDAENQRFVVADLDSDEEEAAFRLAVMPEAEKRRLAREARRRRHREAREAEERKVEEAKAFLRAAGLHVEEDGGSSSSCCSSTSSGSDSDAGDGARAHKSSDKRRRGRRRRSGGRKKREKRGDL